MHSIHTQLAVDLEECWTLVVLGGNIYMFWIFMRLNVEPLAFFGCLLCISAVHVADSFIVVYIDNMHTLALSLLYLPALHRGSILFVKML